MIRKGGGANFIDGGLTVQNLLDAGFPQSCKAIGDSAQGARREEQPDHRVPKLKSSNAVTLSALVQTPTLPASL